MHTATENQTVYHYIRPEKGWVHPISFIMIPSAKMLNKLGFILVEHH